jgi:3-methyl-2-oxobutanoate hydroxymethyltransferase
MSVTGKTKKITAPYLAQMKKNRERISVLTAYDYLTASMVDEAGIDVILVGDSVGMVFAGFESTLPVTMEMMLYHVAAVHRGVKHALLVADMPFNSYQPSEAIAIGNAGRFLKEACAEAVKIEGGAHMVPTITKMVQSGIPVMGHIGLTPQSINQFGSYSVIGREEAVAAQLKKDALALQQAGVFSLVLEKVPANLATEISESLSIPTIGIGAGAGCDGQVLVSHDMLGIFDKFRPKFVRRYAELADTMRKAFSDYNEDVKQGKFPASDESY